MGADPKLSRGFRRNFPVWNQEGAGPDWTGPLFVLFIGREFTKSKPTRASVSSPFDRCPNRHTEHGL